MLPSLSQRLSQLQLLALARRLRRLRRLSRAARLDLRRLPLQPQLTQCQLHLDLQPLCLSLSHDATALLKFLVIKKRLVKAFLVPDTLFLKGKCLLKIRGKC